MLLFLKIIKCAMLVSLFSTTESWCGKDVKYQNYDYIILVFRVGIFCVGAPCRQKGYGNSHPLPRRRSYSSVI